MELKLGLYQHYKGDYYWVQSINRDSDDHSKMLVVYQGLYDHKDEFGKTPPWCREIHRFLEPREDGSPRYKYIGAYPEATQGLEGIILPK